MRALLFAIATELPIAKRTPSFRFTTLARSSPSKGSQECTMGSSSKHSAFSSENTTRSVSNVKVVFGFRTALQIHRSMHDQRMRALCDATAPLKLLEQPAFGLSTCSASIPQAAPSDADLKNMLERMRERNPHLAFDRPVHLVPSFSVRSPCLAPI